MATEFTLPELGENVTSADVVRVLVKPGDTLAANQPVIEVETEKATVEVPSTVAGTVGELLVSQGQKIKVGQAILRLSDGGAVPTGKSDGKAKAAAPPKGPGATTARLPLPAPAAPAPVAAAAKPAALPPLPPLPGDRAAAGAAVRAAPSIRRIARELGVDVRAVRGSGAGGRVSADDVRGAVGGARSAPSAAPTATPLPDFTKWGAVRREPLNNVRRVTARHMAMAWTTIPHVTLHATADVTELESVRKRYQKKAEAGGGKLTITAILAKVVAAALKVHPRLNASLDAGAQEMVLKDYYSIGIAVDTDRGLLVPVLRDVDKKNIIEIAVEMTALAQKARAGRLMPDEMQGQTFTITNLGGFGVGHFSPIVNWPDVAILGVGRADMRPVFVENPDEDEPQFEPRLLMPLSLSIDHRLIDGADGARALQWVVDAIQHPLMLSLEG